MLVLIYHVLRTGEPYKDKQAPPLNEQQKQRLIHHHFNRLGKLGIAIPRTVRVPARSATATTAPPEAPGRSRKPRSQVLENT